jgi:enoyl-CoA hydratase/3-hydroxyacyl-CoA dehydrogenase
MDRAFHKLAVVGAGNMGGGIAQKMAAEGFDVVLLDLDDEKVARGRRAIESTLAEGVERKILKAEQAERTLARIRGTTRWADLAPCDLVVEAVFEDEAVKRNVFGHLDEVCRPEAVLATNTSSLSVTRLAEATRRPERVLGLHYFYHPAKNRLVEVVPGRDTAPGVARSCWSLQEQLGKTPIASRDVFGFIVNRFFVPWLNEAVRLVEEGLADIATVEEACRSTFGIGMGPFQLMNVTGVPIALHAATTLGRELGAFYAPAGLLRRQVEAGAPWSLDGAPDAARAGAVAERMQAVTFHVAAALVEEGVGSIEDTDIGARVGLRWPRGPFEMMNRLGVGAAARLVEPLAERWELRVPAPLRERAARSTPFTFRLVRREVRDGVATLTVNRPDAMNALNETVVAQLHEALREAVADPAVRGIVIAGAGKAFVAGADIRFFVRHIESGQLDRIVAFTEAGHALLDDIAGCAKPVVARLHGLALGGGLELALACQRIVASTRAAMAFPETGIGIYPGLGGTQRTPRRIGPDLAKWLIFTGEMVPAATAHQIGLVDAVVPPAELDAACRAALEGPERSFGERTWPVAYAELGGFFRNNPVERIRLAKADTRGVESLLKATQRVAVKAPVALRLAERLIDEGGNQPLAAGLRLELAHLREIFSTADALEGLSSLGQRKPAFQGR